MSHRLLHTLVFASTSLLACGGTMEELPDDAEPQPDVTPKKKDASPPQVDASVPDVAPEAEPEAAPEAAPEDAGSDARICEGGWPTTKGQICTFDAGIVCCTESWGDDAGPI